MPISSRTWLTTASPSSSSPDSVSRSSSVSFTAATPGGGGGVRDDRTVTGGEFYDQGESWSSGRRQYKQKDRTALKKKHTYKKK